MNYKIKREISPDELYHAKEGEEREDHKYIARVLLKKVNVGGKKKNRYRYFYDKKSYQAYLNSKKSKELKPKTSEGNLLEKNKGSTEKRQNLMSSFLKKNTNKKVEELGSSYESNKDLKDAVTLLIGGVVGYVVKEYLRKKAEEPVVVKTDFTVGPDKEPEKPKPEYKTLLPNGKYKYFDDQDEYEAYKKRENDENEAYHERLEYQQNEPEFMKQIPDISENDIFTAMEDMSKVNELFDPRDDKYSENCSNCSVAYELRRRGYDVEAKPKDDSYNGNYERLYEYFEDVKFIGVYGNGETLIHDKEYYETRMKLNKEIEESYKATEEYEQIINDPNTSIMEKLKTKLKHIKEVDNYLELHDKRNELDNKYKECYDFRITKQSYTPESIEKAIKDNNPPGSRGMIDVEWKVGSAHSIVYEVDLKGKITIRDSQTYDEYGLDELANMVDHVRITRTDNLQLKEGILDAVKINEDKQRKYYTEGYLLRDYVD